MGALIGGALLASYQVVLIVHSTVVLSKLRIAAFSFSRAFLSSGVLSFPPPTDFVSVVFCPEAFRKLIQTPTLQLGDVAVGFLPHFSVLKIMVLDTYLLTNMIRLTH